MGHAAAGILFCCGSQILLLLRSEAVDDPFTWSIPGGTIGFGRHKLTIEEFWLGAIRETIEEIGSMPSEFSAKRIHVQERNDFIYVTFIAEIQRDTQYTWNFQLNWENELAVWFDLTKLPADIHPGLQITLNEVFNLPH